VPASQGTFAAWQQHVGICRSASRRGSASSALHAGYAAAQPRDDRRLCTDSVQGRGLAKLQWLLDGCAGCRRRILSCMELSSVLGWLQLALAKPPEPHKLQMTAALLSWLEQISILHCCRTM
jgi:hypothetical protein